MGFIVIFVFLGHHIKVSDDSVNDFVASPHSDTPFLPSKISI